ncbi:MAG TPA: TetR/AcrR family transcriptional regulator [Nitrospira sp.]|nr:TetR/AcrR family transcriptional regulator [Nitrospira sp.]
MIKASRPYVSRMRSQAADATKARVLRAAKTLFVSRGIDRVTIAQIAKKAKVSVSTVFALYKSKEGILRELMKSALFGQGFQVAIARLKGETNPVRLIALTAAVSRAIYEAESSELGMIRGVSAFSPALQKLEDEFEELRFQMQKERVELLFAQSKQTEGLSLEEARRILWMYTSRDVYRLLVHEGGWTPDRYQDWLSVTLVDALVKPSLRHSTGTSPISGRLASQKR